MNTNKSLISGLLLISLTISCTGIQTSNEKTIVFGKPKDAVTLDVADVTEAESTAVTHNIFDTLVRFKSENTEIEPDLAKEWTVSKDGKVFTFKLKTGIKFHDGTEFDAQSVKFNFDRQMDIKNPYRYKGKFGYWPIFFNKVKNIEAPDKETVVFYLTEPDATFLTNLALFNMGIESPTAIKTYKEDIFKHPVGTGAFQFVSWIRNEKIVLKANPDYYDGAPKIDKLIFKPIPDNSVRLLELEKGTVQGIDGINLDDIPRITGNKDLKFLTQPGMNLAYLALNMEKKPYDNKLVRLAIYHAINRKTLVDAFFAKGTLGEVAKNPIPPTIWGYNNNITDYEYNPGLSKKLLKQAGYEKGFTTILWAMPMPRPYMPQPQRIGEAIQSDLRAVGINAKIITHEWGTYIDKLSNGEHEMAIMGWIGDNGDPDNFLYTLLDVNNTIKPNASNYSFYKNKEVHELLLKAQRVIDIKERTKLYEKVQDIAHNDVAMVPLFHSMQVIAFRSNINGFYLHPTGGKYFRDIYIETK